jgi:hypothetical protein
MPFKRKQRIRMSRPETSDDQHPARKYYLGTIIWFSDRFFPGVAILISDPVEHIGTHDMAMSAIQTSLAVLKEEARKYYLGAII